MVATIESERTTLSQTNKVPMTTSVVACVGALVALIWLAVVTNNLNDTRAKLDITQAATRTLQTQVYDLTQRTQGHESMLNTPQMQNGAPKDTMKPMQGMPGMGMQSMQQPMQQPGAGTMPQPGTGNTPMPMGQSNSKQSGTMGDGMGSMMMPMANPEPAKSGMMGGGMGSMMMMPMGPAKSGTMGGGMGSMMMPMGPAKSGTMGDGMGSMMMPMGPAKSGTMGDGMGSMKMPMGNPEPAKSGAMGSGTPQTMNMSDQELKAEFKDADKNKDGYADFNELVIHEAGDKSLAKLHFDDADRNKDGKVTEAEWLQHHKESPLHKK